MTSAYELAWRVRLAEEEIKMTQGKERPLRMGLIVKFLQI